MTKEGGQELTLDALQKIATNLLLEDKAVQPVVFLCSLDGTIVIEINQEYLEDNDGKEQLIRKLIGEILGKDVFKLILISEIWSQKIPEGMSDNELNDRAEHLEKGEAFQILEITSDYMRVFTQAFVRTEDNVTLSGEGIIEDANFERLQPLQDALYPLE